MAWTNWGFDGTINEAQWSQMAGLLGNGYVAADSASCAVTAVGGTRSVSVAAGTLYGDGVVSVNSGAETVAMTTPVNGQWYVIALRRTWATNTAALVAIAGATTSTTTPTTAPTSFPTMNTNSGVLTDQPIAWAWCNSANTNVVIFDLRLLPMRSQPVSVADAAKRDAKFPAPVQGNQVWRDDIGTVQTYYGLYNASTNPGGRDTAGWYSTDRSGGLIPVRATTVTVGSGSATVNSLGIVSFTGATSISLDGIFTGNYRNYKMILNLESFSANNDLFGRMTASGVENSTLNYHFAGHAMNTASTNGAWVNPSASQLHFSANASTYGGRSRLFVEIFDPAIAKPTNLFWSAMADNGSTWTATTVGGTQSLSTSYDGFKLYVSAGNMTGSIRFYGIADK